MALVEPGGTVMAENPYEPPEVKDPPEPEKGSLVAVLAPFLLPALLMLAAGLVTLYKMLNNW